MSLLPFRMSSSILPRMEPILFLYILKLIIRSSLTNWITETFIFLFRFYDPLTKFAIFNHHQLTFRMIRTYIKISLIYYSFSIKLSLSPLLKREQFNFIRIFLNLLHHSSRTNNRHSRILI